MPDLAPRQVRGQRLTLRGLLGRLRFPERGQCRLQLLDLRFDRGDVGLHRLLEQRALLGVDPLAARAELQALELRDLEGQLVDLGVAPDQLLRVAVGALDQLGSERTQLLGVQCVELGGVDLRARRSSAAVCRLVRASHR